MVVDVYYCFFQIYRLQLVLEGITTYVVLLTQVSLVKSCTCSSHSLLVLPDVKKYW